MLARSLFRSGVVGADPGIEAELEKLWVQGAAQVQNCDAATPPPVQSAPSGAHWHAPVTPPAKPPCQEQPSSLPKLRKISHDDEHHDMIDTMLHGGADDDAKVKAVYDAKLKALERLLEGKSLTGMQPPSVPINVVTKAGALRVLWPDGSVTDDGPPTNDSAIVPFEGEGHGDNLLSDDEKTSFTAALKVSLDFMQKHYADAKKTLVESEQWSALELIQNAVDEMQACMTATPSS